MKGKSYDVLIIGAGMAGVSAARVFEEYNRRVKGGSPINYLIIEADDKIGGRMQSMELSDQGIIINPGAQWIHSDLRKNAQENPILALARKYGLIEHDDMPREFWDGGSRINYDGNIKRINAARQLIDNYNGPDIDLASLFRQQNLGNPLSLITTFGEVETGAPLNQVSAIDVRELVACNKGDFVRNGIGNFFKKYAEDVANNIQLNTQISRIRWQSGENGGVEIYTKDGASYHAKQCILTVSIGVLKSGAIKFEPEWPELHRENLSHINMGNFNKIFLVFDKKFQFPVNHNTHLDVRTKGKRDLFYLARDNGQPLVTTFVGGKLAELCDHEPNKAKELAIKGLSQIWGKSAENHIIATHVTQWGINPHVLGGYSRVDIGHYQAREALALPIGNVLSLAGEALGAKHLETGRDWSTQMPGAALSGQRAANSALKALVHGLHTARWLPIDVFTKPSVQIRG